AARFITPLTFQSLTGHAVVSGMFAAAEAEAHVEVARRADVLVIAPATADCIASLAHGQTPDMVTLTALATRAPLLVAPAMDSQMWEHPATQANMATLKQRGVLVVAPDEGPMACGEFGPGRLAEPPVIFAAIEAALRDGPLKGRHAIVTSGPTHEPIDPVRYLANRSSGKQGHAIAQALAALGARVTLVSGPVTLPDPPGVTTRHVETAREMRDAVQAALPADIAICAAAVADWRVDSAGQKLKKDGSGQPPALQLSENPDILAALSAPGPTRPHLVVGFAAETEKLAEHATAKRARKGCDWLVANNVGGTGIMGGDENEILLITPTSAENWARMNKSAVAARLAERIGAFFA
ncbi:bifunctional phosphopantothenoylcysteine decarboxylase/phosphopantothenate--cysteine ligase CoaBC, partial [Acidocella sp.]|uniref:bifunctional phosphopantothenoylcysteine decarboxylase/phosphopantothenate--cysteine ligase CoaBC n=1 Tax=Acidocella sp. TaxID=50710 RepID=UPI00260EE71E